jgi:alkylhydroperoxidase family enzyme
MAALLALNTAIEKCVVPKVTIGLVQLRASQINGCSVCVDMHARPYDEKALAALILSIALVNVWNRLNVSTRQVASEWVKSAEARTWMESGQ